MNYALFSQINHPRLYFIAGFISFCAGILAWSGEWWLLFWGIIPLFLSLSFTYSIQVFLISIACFTVGYTAIHYTFTDKHGSLEILQNMSEGFSWKYHIGGEITKLLYQTDDRKVFRLNIDTFATESTQYSIHAKDSIGVFFSVPKNLQLKVGDTITTKEKIYPIYTTHTCNRPYGLCDFAWYAWKEFVYGRVYPRTFQTTFIAPMPWRNSIQEWTKQTIFRGFPRDIAWLLLGITIGNTDLFTSELKESYKHSGLTHILVVSGSNIALVIVMLTGIIRYIPVWRIGRMGIIGVFLWLYGTLVWWDPPIIRATIMGILSYMALNYRSSIRPFIILIAVAWWYLIWSPDALFFDASFWLSFAATMGIIVLYPNIEEWLQKIRIPKMGIALIGVTLAATIGSTPALIFYFENMAVLGIISNVLVGGILSLLLIITTVYIGLATIFPPIVLYVIWWIIYPIAWLIHTVALFFGQFSLITVPEMLVLPCSFIGIVLLFGFGVYKELLFLKTQNTLFQSK